jgi:hypothetical protein
MTGINASMDAGGVGAVVGFINGFTASVNTDWYIGSVIEYAHATLALSFNQWMNNIARMNPHAFQHVYEWPRVWHNYTETVGVDEDRLWKNTLSGRGRDRTVGFKLLASRRPTPVDPILLEPGPSGKSVKEGIHIFTWKAPVFEYNLPVHVEPKLAKMLAYVHKDGWNGAGSDSGVQMIDNQREDATGITFSYGPVNFDAGGTIIEGQPFTKAFLLWWTEMALNVFRDQILPKLEANLISEQEMDKAIRKGNTTKSKTMSLTADNMINEGRMIAAANAKAVSNGYIEMARQRRDLKYGEEGWEE